jgi:hypothetical protein
LGLEVWETVKHFVVSKITIVSRIVIFVTLLIMALHYLHILPIEWLSKLSGVINSLIFVLLMLIIEQVVVEDAARPRQRAADKSWGRRPPFGAVVGPPD